jgi:hypothetical protein
MGSRKESISQAFSTEVLQYLLRMTCTKLFKSGVHRSEHGTQGQRRVAIFFR